MYRTSEVDAVATISELRSKTSELLDHVRARHTSVLIQKNNEPFAVLLSWDAYQSLIEASQEAREPAARPPMRQPRKPKENAGEGAVS